MSTQNIFTKILIEATTEAATSPTFAISQDQTSVTLIANGLAGSENIQLQVYDAAQDDWYDAAPLGTDVELTSAINILGLNIWGQYRMVKSATVAAVGLTSVQFNNSQQ